MPRDRRVAFTSRAQEVGPNLINKKYYVAGQQIFGYLLQPLSRFWNPKVQKMCIGFNKLIGVPKVKQFRKLWHKTYSSKQLYIYGATRFHGNKYGATWDEFRLQQVHKHNFNSIRFSAISPRT